MVKECKIPYKSTIYEEIFKEYPFELDHFQKYSIHAIMEEKHSLVTAHTGSGKTLPAEYAIDYFCGQKSRKVIYTSPIKSLSNQKFYEFTKKFPSISIGICTGDIKYNTDADCIIMTTEILRNYLIHPKESNLVDFEIDIDNELNCIIFDEVHYINDSSRGHIWEECIMLLPLHIQLVMLSATISNTHSFAKWIEYVTQRDVWISGSTHRVVPLKHFGYIQSFKIKKDSKIEKTREKIHGKLIPIKNNETDYHQKNVSYIESVKYAMEQENIKINASFVLNEIISFLKQTNKLPAICFIFSRHKVETYAKYIQLNLFTDEESKKASLVEQECFHIISSRLQNYNEYIQSNEYQTMLALLKKGIAIHHSGIVPILKEMVELLFEKGYIKLLFATETFAVGINMPTKTVLFTSLEKFDGMQKRPLLSSEYTQMAGRAGRRGLDEIGYVIHLNNLFSIENHGIYKNIISGSNLELRSKFYLHYSLFLKLLQKMNMQQENFLQKSLYYDEQKREQQIIEKEIILLKENIEKNNTLYDSFHQIEVLEEKINYTKRPKEREELKKNIYDIKIKIKNYEEELYLYNEYKNGIQNIIEKEDELKYMENSNQEHINRIYSYMLECGCITNKNTMGIVEITSKGLYASKIHEVHPLLFADMIEARDFTMLSIKEVVAIFSCFTDIRVDDSVAIYDYNGNKNVNKLLQRIKWVLDYYYDNELKTFGFLEEDEYYFHFDLIDAVMRWCDVKNEKDAKQIIQELYNDKGIFPGEFVKAILKINAIAKEIEMLCVDYHIQLQYICSEIPKHTLKYIALNQSLYV